MLEWANASFKATRLGNTSIHALCVHANHHRYFVGIALKARDHHVTNATVIKRRQPLQELSKPSFTVWTKNRLLNHRSDSRGSPASCKCLRHLRSVAAHAQNLADTEL